MALKLIIQPEEDMSMQIPGTELFRQGKSRWESNEAGNTELRDRPAKWVSHREPRRVGWEAWLKRQTGGQGGQEAKILGKYGLSPSCNGGFQQGVI